MLTAFLKNGVTDIRHGLNGRGQVPAGFIPFPCPVRGGPDLHHGNLVQGAATCAAAAPSMDSITGENVCARAAAFSKEPVMADTVIKGPWVTRHPIYRPSRRVQDVARSESRS